MLRIKIQSTGSGLYIRYSDSQSKHDVASYNLLVGESRIIVSGLINLPLGPR